MNNILMQHLKIILSKNEMNEFFFAAFTEGWQLTISRTFPSFGFFICGLQWNEVYVYFRMNGKSLSLLHFCSLKFQWVNFDGNKTFHKHAHDVETKHDRICMSELLSLQWVTFRDEIVHEFKQWERFFNWNLFVQAQIFLFRILSIIFRLC